MNGFCYSHFNWKNCTPLRTFLFYFYLCLPYVALAESLPELRVCLLEDNLPLSSVKDKQRLRLRYCEGSCGSTQSLVCSGVGEELYADSGNRRK